MLVLLSCEIQLRSDSRDNRLRVTEGMRPDPDYFPSCRLQFASRFPVAERVPKDFILPVCPIRSRHPAVRSAAVPEAAVNEERNTLAAENEVGVAFYRLMPTPAGKASGTEQVCHLQFSFFVPARAHSGHDLGPLPF